jgi:hypothetical protein
MTLDVNQAAHQVSADYERKLSEEIASMRKTVKGIQNLNLDKPLAKRNLKQHRDALVLLEPSRVSAPSVVRISKRYDIFIEDTLLGDYKTPEEALHALAEYFGATIAISDSEISIAGPDYFDSCMKVARRLLSKIEGLVCKM